MTPSRLLPLTALLLLALGAFTARPAAALAPGPVSVTLAGNFQDELGCPGDWMPSCANTMLAYDAGLDRWVGNFTIPAGNFEYKIAINGTWDENYGAGGVQNGPNIPLSVVTQQNVTFVYDPYTHVVTHNVSPVVVAPGSHQSELGCPGDWMPDCLDTQLFDPDLDGVFAFTTGVLPPGDYEFKIALGLTWDLNYGAGGVQNGPNVPFTVPPSGAIVTFQWNSSTLVPSVIVDTGTPVRATSWGRLKVMHR